MLLRGRDVVADVELAEKEWHPEHEPKEAESGARKTGGEMGR